MSGTTFGFQGQRYDAETGLYYFKQRYYSPKTGRFLQPDPIKYGDGLNLYQFAYNNPNSFTDSLGENTTAIVVTVIVIIIIIIVTQGGDNRVVGRGDEQRRVDEQNRQRRELDKN